MLTPTNEPVVIHSGAQAVDDDGIPIAGGGDTTVAAVTVQPLTLEELNALGRDGTVDGLRLWLPSGPTVEPGDKVTVRGLSYRVEKTAWDWGARRRPVLARHHPSTVVDCVRGVG